MVRIQTIRRLASSICKVGSKKIWLDPAEEAKITAATSRADVSQLISDGFIVKRPHKIKSRFHARKIASQKAKGRRMGPGKVRGSKNARMPEKERWMKKIREMRSKLVELRNSNVISPTEKKSFYMQAKGNLFKNTSAMIDMIKTKQADKVRKQHLAEQVEVINLSNK
ncbi:60S ribosomal protein L19-2 [Cucumispora dikerogammari]|nr:60S ribosomal protein L19-2 [Cucumispora dikerogammari]